MGNQAKKEPTPSPTGSEVRLARDGVEDRVTNADDSAPILRQTANPAETAQYIADMLVDLRSLADSANHQFLAFLLDLAAEEAELLSKRRS